MFVYMGRTFLLIFALLGAAVSGVVAEDLTEAEALRRFSEDSPRARGALPRANCPRRNPRLVPGSEPDGRRSPGKRQSQQR